VTINYSWMHVTRESPLAPGLPFNDCTHQDGYQIYNGGVQKHLLIENSVVGPGLGENFILGQSPNSANDHAVVNDVTLRNVLTIGKDRNILGYPQVLETGWVIDHVTAITQGSGISGGTYEALFLQGSNNRVTNSIFYDGLIYLPDGLVKAAGNCQWKTTGDTSALGGQTVNPQFTTDISSYNYNTPLATTANADYALRLASTCKGAGSSITSVNRFLQLVSGTTPWNRSMSDIAKNANVHCGMWDLYTFLSRFPGSFSTVKGLLPFMGKMHLFQSFALFNPRDEPVEIREEIP
jgi:hypothetical protein